MSTEERKEQKIFENEVRRIARNLWPGAEFDRSAMIGARETDGVFETEECIHLLEATVSRQEKKAQQDIKKLDANSSKLVSEGIVFTEPRRNEMKFGFL